MTAKKRAMNVFMIQAEESNDEVDINAVKITNTKDTAFNTMRRFVARGAMFWMTDNLIWEAYYVLTNPLMRACGDQLVSS